MATVSKVDLFNMALTLLGAETVSSPTANTKGARACLQIYDMVRRAELRKKPNWAFSIKLAQLSAEATTPLFGMEYAYPFPADYIEMVPPYPYQNYGDRDYTVQGRKIYSRFSAPLDLRYVADIEDVSEMDPLFHIVLASKMAFTICDTIVQSNAKKKLAAETYAEAHADARKANSFSSPPQEFPIDPWLVARR